MDKITPYDYHNNEDNHGNYQYMPLKELVNTLEFEFNDEDHILKNTRRSRILNHAKNGIREYNKQTFNDILAMEITVPENLVFALPHNFVSYVRCSLVIEDPVTNSYRLKPLDINRNMNIADGYLQDHNAEILFDESGGILMADSTNVYAKPYKKYYFDTTSQPTKDTSKLSKYGEFTIDERKGKIAFSSDLYDKEIVLEYVSDGLEFDTYNEGEISIHKDLVKVLKEWVFYESIKGKRNVSATAIETARRRMKTAEHQAKLDRSDLNLLEISRAMRLSSKNL